MKSTSLILKYIFIILHKRWRAIKFPFNYPTFLEMRLKRNGKLQCVKGKMGIQSEENTLMKDEDYDKTYRL